MGHKEYDLSFFFNFLLYCQDDWEGKCNMRYINHTFSNSWDHEAVTVDSYMAFG